MEKVLIIDAQTQVPMQLDGKFHRVITIPDSEQLLKYTNIDVGIQETVEKYHKTIEQYLNKSLLDIFNTSGAKKFSFNVEMLFVYLENPVYLASIADKYDKTYEEVKELRDKLFENRSVKAKFTREYNSNPLYEIFRLERKDWTDLITALKKSTASEYFSNSKSLFEKLKTLGDAVKDDPTVKSMYDACINIGNACNYKDQLVAKFSNIDEASKIGKKGIYELLGGNKKVQEEIFKLVELYKSLIVANDIVNLPANDYLVVGENPAKVVNKLNNLGLRKTTAYYQLIQLQVCKTGTGANIVFIRTLSGAQANITKLTYFFGPNMAVSLVPEFPSVQRQITTSEEAIKTLQALINMPEGHDFGFDYETNGKKIRSKEFETIGYSIANTKTAVYIDWRYIKLKEGPAKLAVVKSKTKEFLDKHASRDSKSKTWVFNYSFELNVSYKEFGVFYEFWDAVVFRNVQGYHMQWWSLKYTAQHDLRVRSWDDSYDGIMARLYPLLYEWDPLIGDKGGWKPRNDRNYFSNGIRNDEEMNQYYESFMWLYDNGYNTEFTCIPVELIGKYGALDSYYTVWIANINKGKYDDRCMLTFMDNIRMGARLAGIFRDDNIFNNYLEDSKHMLAYSVFHLARHSAYNYVQTEYRKPDVPFSSDQDLDNFIHAVSENEFTKWAIKHPIDISNKPKLGRSMLMYFCSPENDRFINTNRVYSELPKEYAERFLNIVMLYDGDWMIKNKYNNWVQSDQEFKEISSKVAEVFWPLLIINTDKKDWVQVALRLSRTNSNRELLDKSQLNKLNYHEFCKLEKFNLGFRDYDLNQILAKLYEYYQITSPGVFKDTFDRLAIIHEKEYKVLACLDSLDVCNNGRPDLISKYLPFTSWDDMVSKIDEIWNTDEGGDRYDSFGKSLGKINVRNAFLAEEKHPKKENDYPQAKRTYYINDDQFNEGYTDVIVNEMYNKIVNFKDIPYGAPLNDILITALGCMGKRQTKMISNYFNGVYSGCAEYQCTPDENLYSVEEGPVFRMYPGFNVNTVTTKRWSSGYHTIYGKSTSKRVLVAPPGYLVSYFDISSAEVRSAAYMSGDPVLIKQFEDGLDPYIELARKKYGQDAPKSVLKANRKKYKTALLAQLYGQSVDSMGVRLKITSHEAEEIVAQMRQEYQVLFKWIERKQLYCVANRKIETFLGDDLEIFEFNTGRLKRCGINYCIQGNTAAILAHGFYNIIRNSDKLGFGINPFITVHDSSINYVPIKHLAELNDFYWTHFTEYIKAETGIVYTFDTMIGADYTVPCILGNEGGKIQLEGNDYALNDIVNQIEKSEAKIKWEGDIPVFNTELTDGLQDMMYNFDAASFGTCKHEQKIEFSLEY